MRKQIEQRWSEIKKTTEVRRYAKDFKGGYGSFLMEESLDFITTYSYYVFSDDVLPQTAKQLFGYLRIITIFIFKPKKAAKYKLTTKLVLQSLDKFCKVIEECLPRQVCVHNLHVLRCQLPR